MRLRSHATSRDERAVLASTDQVDAALVGASQLPAEELARVAEFRQRTGMSFADAVIDLGLATSESLNRTIVECQPGGLIDPGTSGVSAAVVAAFGGDDPLTIKLRSLRAALLGPDGLHGGSMRVLVLSGVCTGGCSGVAANLAVLVAQLGQPVLLVDADFAAPTQHVLFGIAGGAGVTSLLANTSLTETLVVPTPVPNLDLLSAGPAIPMLSETVERVSLVKRLRAMRKNYVCAIIDAGDQPADMVAAISRGADGVIPVVERGSTGLQELKTLLAQLERNKIPISGTVLA